MRIEAIDTYVAGHWLFVSITTECGITGIGESTYFTYPLAARAIIDDLTAELLGADPSRPEFHFNRLLKHHCLRDAAMMGALSAIDQALWDIKGKALGVPVYDLLGGRVRDKIRAILLVEAQSELELIEKAIDARNEGFTAIKIKPFMGNWSQQPTSRFMSDVVQTVHHVRESLGWDIDIAVEIHRNLTPDLAVEFAEGIRTIRPYFIEDPILPFSTACNGRTAGAMPGTLALAERNTNIWEFREISDYPGVAIIRPDVGLAGGFTQLKKIAAIAESVHQRIVPHNFTAPVSTACHIQLAACTTNWDVQGYVRENRSPWLDVVKKINVLENGFLLIPDQPGIGVELNIDYLKTATYQPFGTKFHHGAARAMDGGIKHQ
jgi:galactonate dehydratase